MIEPAHLEVEPNRRVLERGQEMYTFGLRGEAVQAIRATYPGNSLKDRRVASVTAFGYPALFLADGASEVESFDLSKDSVVWNKIIRQALLTLDYEKACAFFQYDPQWPTSTDVDYTSAGVVEVIEEVIETAELTSADRTFARSLYAHYLWKMGSTGIPFTDKLGSSNVLLGSEQRYEKAARTTKDGHWNITQANVTDHLQLLANEGRQLDYAFLSNIRSFDAEFYNLRTRRRSDPTAQERTARFNNTISHTIKRLIVPRGCVYEAETYRGHISPLDLPADEWTLTMKGLYDGVKLNNTEIDDHDLPRILHYSRY